MSPTTHVEVEDKYDADGSFRLPALRSLPGVVRVGRPEESALLASYLDTDDLRLATRGITLRRRTGGVDAGWQLKLPRGDGARVEFHRPLGSSRRAHPPVPVSLLRLIRAFVRDAPLAPILRLKTRRIVHRLYGAGDTLLAEVADDQVSADLLGAQVGISTWREIEVELVAGDRELLAAAGALLSAAGARPAAAASKLARALGDRLTPEGTQHGPAEPKKSAAGSVVLRYLIEQVEELLTADAAVREGRHDSVHKMRVSTRRMRSVLASYRPLFDDTVTDPLRAELKWLGAVLGEVRDAEVMHAHLVSVLGDLPDDLLLGPVRARVDTDLRGSYREARKQLLSELDGARYFTLLDDLDGFIRTPALTVRAGDSAVKVMPRRVDRERRRLAARHRAGAPVSPADADNGALHEIRKAAKRVRYAAEAAVPTIGRRAEHLIDAVTAVQKTLGVYQDTVVLRTALRRMGCQAFLAGENGFTFGILHGLEQVRGDQAVRQFAHAWKEALRAGPLLR